MNSEVLLVLTTLSSLDSARMFSRKLIDQKLAACVSIKGKVSSMYIWKDKICEDEEWQLFIKTTRSTLTALDQFFDQEHPYDCPEYLVLNTVHDTPYAQYVESLAL